MADKDHFKHGINQWTGEPNKPVLLLMDIAKYPEFLAIRLYESNFSQFDGSAKERVIDYVSKVKKLIESYGVRCELEGVPDARVL
jgi:isochorismate hydrolase